MKYKKNVLTNKSEDKATQTCDTYLGNNANKGREQELRLDTQEPWR